MDWVTLRSRGKELVASRGFALGCIRLEIEKESTYVLYWY